MSYAHFETLWTASEELYKTDIGTASTSAIITELQAKLALYAKTDAFDKIPPEEKHRSKTILFGKILSSLTQLALKDDINSFSALLAAVKTMEAEKAQT
jgi:hypothetical protein